MEPHYIRPATHRASAARANHCPRTCVHPFPRFAYFLGRYHNHGEQTRPLIPFTKCSANSTDSVQNVLHFFHSLRALLRKYPHGCASITLSPQLSSDTWGGSGWLQKVGWLTDAAIKMIAFSGERGKVCLHELPLMRHPIKPTPLYQQHSQLITDWFISSRCLAQVRLSHPAIASRHYVG